MELIEKAGLYVLGSYLWVENHLVNILDACVFVLATVCVFMLLSEAEASISFLEFVFVKVSGFIGLLFCWIYYISRREGDIS